MKNTIKKLVFIITIVFLSVSLAGCSTKTPSSQEAIDKYTEALKNIKSETYNSDVTIKDILRNKENTYKFNINGTIVDNPLAMNVNIKIDDTALSLYMKNSNSLYVKQNSLSWRKYKSSSETLERFDSANKISRDKENIDFLKSNANDFKVEQHGDNYVLTYSGSDAKYKDFLISSFIGFGEMSEFKRYDLKNITIKQTIKKSSFEPVELNITSELTYKYDSSVKSYIEIKTTTSNINLGKVAQPDDLKVTNNL